MKNYLKFKITENENKNILLVWKLSGEIKHIAWEFENYLQLEDILNTSVACLLND